MKNEDEIKNSLWPASKSDTKSGFALIVVLFSLSALTLIFGVATSNTITHIKAGQTNNALSLSFYEAANQSATLLNARELEELPVDMQTSYTLQPATGLIDLNTAAPALLELLLLGYGLDANQTSRALNNYRAWRREGRKLLRVSDFHRVSGLTRQQLPGLELIATVYSGRTGIAPEHAPLQLLQHILQTSGGRDTLVEQLDPAFLSPGSMVNLNVLNGDRSIAVLHFGGTGGMSRTLQLN